MKFGYTFIFVPDIQKTLHFYKDAFGFKVKFIAESGLYGEMDTGATILAFCAEKHIEQEKIPFQPVNPSDLAPPMEIGFITEDVEKAFEKAIKAGACVIKKPHTTRWGQLVACVRDINGLLVELCSPINY